jgi:hypothetical protein
VSAHKPSRSALSYSALRFLAYKNTNDVNALDQLERNQRQQQRARLSYEFISPPALTQSPEPSAAVPLSPPQTNVRFLANAQKKSVEDVQKETIKALRDKIRVLELKVQQLERKEAPGVANSAQKPDSFELEDLGADVWGWVSRFMLHTESPGTG